MNNVRTIAGVNPKQGERPLENVCDQIDHDPAEIMFESEKAEREKERQVYEPFYSNFSHFHFYVLFHFFARVAQWIERFPPEEEVAGSTPAASILQF